MGGRSRCAVAEHVLTRTSITPRAGGAKILKHHRHPAFFSRISARAPTLLAGAPRSTPTLDRRGARDGTQESGNRGNGGGGGGGGGGRDKSYNHLT